MPQGLAVKLSSRWLVVTVCLCGYRINFIDYHIWKNFGLTVVLNVDFKSWLTNYLQSQFSILGLKLRKIWRPTYIVMAFIYTYAQTSNVDRLFSPTELEVILISLGPPS